MTVNLCDVLHVPGRAVRVLLNLSSVYGYRWRFAVAVARWSSSTQLLYIKPS